MLAFGDYFEISLLLSVVKAKLVFHMSPWYRVQGATQLLFLSHDHSIIIDRISDLDTLAKLHRKKLPDINTFMALHISSLTPKKPIRNPRTYREVPALSYGPCHLYISHIKYLISELGRPEFQRSLQHVLHSLVVESKWEMKARFFSLRWLLCTVQPKRKMRPSS